MTFNFAYCILFYHSSALRLPLVPVVCWLIG